MEALFAFFADLSRDHREKRPLRRAKMHDTHPYPARSVDVGVRYVRRFFMTDSSFDGLRLETCALACWACAALACTDVRPISEPPAQAPPSAPAPEPTPQSAYARPRISFLAESGTLYLRPFEAAEGASWTRVADDVAAFELVPSRVGVLHRDGTLRVADETNLHELLPVDSHVARFQLAGHRIGTLHADGTFRLAEWGTEPATRAQGVKAMQVLVDRVGLLGFDGVLWIQDGTGDDVFHKVADHVRTFQLEREWVAYLSESGTLRVGSGTTANMAFVEHAQGVTDFEMETWRNENLETRIRLAHVSGQSVFAGQGYIEPLILGGILGKVRTPKVPHVSAEVVHWSAGSLLAQRGDLSVLGIVNADNMFVPRPTAGAPKRLWAQDGATAIQRGRDLVVTRAPPTGDSRGQELAFALPEGVSIRAGSASVALSSSLPVALRRARTLASLPSNSVVGVTFISPGEPAGDRMEGSR